MRVESSKTNQDNKSNQSVKNTENVSRTTPNNNTNLTANNLNAPPAPTTGAFEKIMNEARQQSVKDEKTAFKPEIRAENSESSDIKKDEEKEVRVKDELKERHQNKGGGNEKGESGDENENPLMLGSLGVFANGKVKSEIPFAAARSILHVADLERIVSMIRTIEAKNSQQVLIALKNSVLEGLQIKITVDENGKLKAEFLALNEKIKEQLKARKNELSEIFKNRGLKFSELEIQTQSELETDQTNKEDSTKIAGNSL